MWNPVITALQRVVTRAVVAEREACAKLCEEKIMRPAGHGGRWEGYGPFADYRNGKELAALIRARPSPDSGDAVQ